jgi:predicted nucleotidyltransferase
MLDALSYIPARFQPAYQQIKQLELHERYLGAFIFGSLARGEATEASDLDVKVAIDADNPCHNINHPVIQGVKLDISFNSMTQLRQQIEQEIELRERIPMIAESIIVFDKTGELTAMRALAQQVHPRPLPEESYQFMLFIFYHGNDKVERNLERDPLTALLAMHVGLDEFLHYHYQLQQRWFVSSKRMLADLRSWDAALAQLLERFVTTCDVQTKYHYWSAIIDHILAPIGGRQPISENNCTCETCRRDLAMFQ